VVSFKSVPMQSQNPILDEFARLTTGAMSLAQAAGDEAKSVMRAQMDRLIVEMDLVRREELETLKHELEALKAELTTLKADHIAKID
jgi:BMFP domain-containing protein YqiC